MALRNLALSPSNSDIGLNSELESVVLSAAAVSVASSQALVVTPNVVRHDEDLRRSLQCKEQARDDANLKR